MSEENVAEGFAPAPQQKALLRRLAEGDASTWRASCALALDGPVDAERVESALRALAARHEILRTAYRTLPGTSVPVQVILDEPAVEIGAAPDAPFDLEHGPFVRATVEDGRVVLSQPALSTDPTSLGLLARALADELAGGGAEGDGDDGPMQYADLAEWQNEMFDAPEAEDALTTWKAVDLDAAAATRLPLAHARSGDAPFAVATTDAVTVDLAALQAAAARVGVSAPAFVLAAWTALVARLADHTDVVLGVTADGRAYEGLDAALGLFQRVLPVGATVDPDASFEQLARSLAAAVGAATEIQEYWSPERVVGAGPPPDLPTTFEYLSRVDGVSERHAVTDRFQARLTCEERADGLALSLAYDANLFDVAEAASVRDAAVALLSNAIADPSASVASRSALGEAARERVLGELASTHADHDADDCIHRLIEARVAESPDAVAVASPTGDLTYRELDARANRLARKLRQLGVEPDARVAVCMDRSAELIVALLAVHKAGGGYVPIAPDYPADRMAYLLADSAAPVLVTRSSVAASVPAHDAATVVVDEVALDEFEDSPLEGGATPESLAYVIYTSGSTGKPKGVLVEHRNLVHSTRARMGYYDAPVGSYLLLPSFAFDSSVAGIFWTLCQGGTLVLPPEGFEQDLAAVTSLVRERAVSHVLGLPSVWSVLLDLAENGELSSVSTAIVAGETCPPDLLRKHREKAPSTRLFNEYGPTEGTVWSTVFDCAQPFARPQVPIGRPVPGVSAYVLSPDLAPVAIGEAGELAVGGPGVARGYLGRDDLTAEKFVENPFGEGRLYRTGDRVRHLPDGTIEFLGRVDNQVKIRGYRIELEEIESVLAGAPGVKEAAVLAREDERGEKRLAAYFTGDGAQPDVDAVRAFLGERLPEYMVPAQLVPLDAMPLNANGKVDRKALPDPGDVRSGDEYVAPRNPTEEQLAADWAEVLGVERVGVRDNFFELGGHSLMATVLMARIRKSLGKDVPFRAFFEAPTIEGMAELLQRPDGDGGPQPPPMRKIPSIKKS